LEYSKIAKDPEKVIQYSMKKECPKCLIKNRFVEKEYNAPNIKDGNCTHLSCNQCNMKYCYVCGGHEEVIDKSFKVNKAPIYRHNEGWSINKKRCPMYLKEFSSDLKDWPKNEKASTDKFEKYKTMSFIKCVVQKNII